MPLRQKDQDRWLIFIVLIALVPLFQNLSPFDPSRIEIRIAAPAKPPGAREPGEERPLLVENPGSHRKFGEHGTDIFEHNFYREFEDFESLDLTTLNDFPEAPFGDRLALRNQVWRQIPPDNFSASEGIRYSQNFHRRWSDVGRGIVDDKKFLKNRLSRGLAEEP